MSEINEKLNSASTKLSTMLDYLGLDATVKAEEKNGKIFLKTSSENAGRIIGKKGQTLQSLELLINRMASRDDSEFPWIAIDVDGYSSLRPKFSSQNRRGEKEFDKKRPVRKFPQDEDTANSDLDDDENAEILKKQAMDAAKEVKKWGEPVTLRPMNSHDRRVVHVSLKEDTDLSTESIPVDSTGRLKKIVISLKDKK